MVGGEIPSLPILYRRVKQRGHYHDKTLAPLRRGFSLRESSISAASAEPIVMPPNRPHSLSIAMCF
jgi:hypothetical protein